jgi:PAS domain S-box-containing protein
VLLVAFGHCPLAWGQAHLIGAAAPGLLEVGAPQFAISSQNDIGLNAPPTDFRVMPDGQVLVYAPGQLALGDGLRWEVFQQESHEGQAFGTAVAVDRDGGVYTCMPDGFGKVEFKENGKWRVRLVAPWQGNEAVHSPNLLSVIQDGDDWYWHGGSGPLLGWRPGVTPRVLGRADTFEHAFRLGDASYLSDRTSGQLFKLNGETMQAVAFLPEISVSETITCSAPFGEGRLLVGTYAHGLWVFDGFKAVPFVHDGLLSTEVRINAICEVPGGLYAAAVENYGVVFFDAQGRTMQVLDSAVDHRLTHVRRLQSVAGGVIWGLLGDGILSIEFPSRLSHFEPLIGSGVAIAHPYRFNGRLWMLADGKIRQGLYDAAGRLTGFPVDTPPERFAFALSVAGGRMIVGTNRGSYFRGPNGWEAFAPNTVNLRILDPKPVDGRWLYGAQDEVGWLRPTPEGFELFPTTIGQLGNMYNCETDADGSIWLELGNSRLGRLQRNGERLAVETFDQKDGLPEGWAQVFKIGGHVGFNFNQFGVLRFDPASRRFVRDTEFGGGNPLLANVYGRPVRDLAGRLWATISDEMHVFEGKGGAWRDLHEKMPPGLRPYFLCLEEGGVVWLHREYRLVRYDPAMPVATPAPLQALITRVEFPITGRNWFVSGREMPALAFEDNSLVAHFVAPGSVFAGSVTFEVNLEGTDDKWVDAGSGGSVGFNRLKEGRYVLHVRPRTSESVGEETVVAFVVHPPWYRTRTAYVLYGLSALALVLLVAWLASFLQRRENTRLERLVAQRTHELVTSNRKLENQVEEIRRLSQAVEQSPNGIALATPDGSIVFANPHFCGIYGYDWPELKGRNIRHFSAEPLSVELEKEISEALAAGESWRGQLTHRTKDGHTIRVRVILAGIRSPDGIIKHFLALHEDITEWLAEQERRRRLESQLLQAQKLDALGTLAGGIAHDFNNILTGILGFSEIAKQTAGDNFELQDSLAEIRKAGLRAKDLVARILTFTRQGNTQLQPLDLAPAVMEAVKLLRASTPATIEVVAHLESGTIRADPTQIQQVVINLGTNAVHAIGDRPGRIDITVQPVQVDDALASEMRDLAPGDWVKLTLSDNGHGMDPSTINRMFEPFFTTKRPGEGTGLGLAIVRAILTSHHGAVRVQSRVGAGTTFELFFPKSNEMPLSTSDPSTPSRGGNREILVVDDEVSVGKFVAVYLQKLGYRPEVFTDPCEALAAYEKAPSRFGAIVTDLTMPHMTGAEMLERIRAKGRAVPAVIISGYSEDLMRLRSETVTHCAVLQKPFTGEDLGRSLEQVIRSMESGGKA